MVDDTTINTCSGRFYDSGGPNDNYGSSQDMIMTFCSATPDSSIYFIFGALQTEEYYDSLIVYNGSSVSESILGTYTGNISPGDVISSNPTNCLTFRFISDGSIQLNGWSSTIGCGSLPPLPPPPPPGLWNRCDSTIVFCTDSIYRIPAARGQVAELGPDYSCLFVRPNPIWFSALIEQPGALRILINSTDSSDIDFVCWGPYSTPYPCNLLTGANVMDCSYTSSSIEKLDIYNAQSGQYYIFCVTSFSDEATTIMLRKDSLTSATTSCDESCRIAISSKVTSCNSEDDVTSIKCKVWKPGQANEGLLVINTSTGHSGMFSPPFSNEREYEIFGVPVGSNITLSSFYTSDSNCVAYTSIPTSISNLSVSGVGQNVLAPGESNGLGYIHPEGGLPPYTYNWNNGSNHYSAGGLSEGTYYFTVTDVRGCQASDSITIGYGLQTNMMDISKEVSFRTMPNPVNDELRFEFNTAIQGEGYIFGTDGKLFETFAINNQVETLNISNLPSGVYVVQVKERNSNKASFTRIVKY